MIRYINQLIKCVFNIKIWSNVWMILFNITVNTPGLYIVFEHGNPKCRMHVIPNKMSVIVHM